MSQKGSDCDYNDNDSDNDSDLTFDVVVVGAGLSGLFACDILSTQKEGLKVCLLEARDRIGGRLETHADGGFDLGGQWIGPAHAELLQLIHKYNLTLVEQYYDDHDPNGGPQRLTECVGLTQFPLDPPDELQIQNYMQLIDQLSAEIDPHAPWNHPMAETLDSLSAADHVLAHVSSPTAQADLLLFCQTYLACRPESVSFLFFLFDLRSGGGMAALDHDGGPQKWKLEGGMAALYCRMEQDLLLRTRRTVTILKSCPVVSVRDDGTGNGKVELGVKDGRRKIFCDRVILALSPQLLSKISFYPPLDEGRQELWRAIVPGKTIKVFVSFENPFWLQSKNPNHAASLAFANGPVHIFCHTTITSGSNNNDSSSQPALVGLITGAAAEECETCSDLQHRVVQQIQAVYQVVDEPVTFVEKRWGLEEFSGGCYAGVYAPNGSLFRLGQLLRTPEGRMHWASTETATEFYGYMEGALLAGKRVAYEVLAYY
jgi:monoamine oxidase